MTSHATDLDVVLGGSGLERCEGRHGQGSEGHVYQNVFTVSKRLEIRKPVFLSFVDSQISVRSNRMAQCRRSGRVG